MNPGPINLTMELLVSFECLDGEILVAVITKRTLIWP